MSRTDLISDVLTLIRNASNSKKESVDVPKSKPVVSILGVLKKEGFISNFKPIDVNGKSDVRVYLKYAKGKRPVITNLRRISRPGLRVYTKNDKLPNVYGGLGVAIVSTSKGIITNREAKDLKLGGEVLCYVW